MPRTTRATCDKGTREDGAPLPLTHAGAGKGLQIPACCFQPASSRSPSHPLPAGLRAGGGCCSRQRCGRLGGGHAPGGPGAQRREPRCR